MYFHSFYDTMSVNLGVLGAPRGQDHGYLMEHGLPSTVLAHRGSVYIFCLDERMNGMDSGGEVCMEDTE